jgi:predicted ATPase/predicted Ser/Thr protein kinase
MPEPSSPGPDEPALQSGARHPAPDDSTIGLGASGAGAAGSTIPERLGPYRVVRELGRGGMGVVLLAHDARLGRDIAIKLLPVDAGAADAVRERLLSEARALATMNHPNIATIHSLEEDADHHFITMELVEGRSLHERLRAGPLPIEETLSVVRQVVRGLEAAHAKGVIHRDLKPANIMLRPDGTAKVLDFGLAVQLRSAGDADPIAPESAQVAGTPGYMSPEQVRGEPTDARTDVWAVGCLLYECLNGRPLIAGRTLAERFRETLSLDPAAASTAGIPQRLDQVLQRCLAQRPADRLGTMHEVRALLEEEIAERALSAAAPALPTAAAVGNLPRRLTSFVGRAQDLSETARLLGEHRLLTLTGAGGCGKTRMALELAVRQQDLFAGGTWIAELAPLADPELVPATVATALGTKLAPGMPATNALTAALAQKPLLLILDNCEHLLDPCAELVTRLLDQCPGVRVLATSREALRVEGERVYALAPLTLPGGGVGAPRPTPTPRLSGSPPAAVPSPAPEPDADAVLLFVERARAVEPGFRIDATNRGTIHEICRRLDGIPLAIELAAARTHALSVDKIRDLLSDRFRLLTRGARSAQAHQSTLRMLIDWSFDRLDPLEQAVLRRVSVFRGAWSLEAVEAVGAGGDVDPWDALDLFTRLVEKSLVVRDVAAQSTGSARYYLYETVRAYAQEKLAEHPTEARATETRLRDYIVALTAEGDPGLRGRDQAQWAARLADALDDVRAVLSEAAADPHGAETALRVAGTYWLAWMNRGMWKECADEITRALAHPGADTTSAPYGRALLVSGNVAYRLGELDRAREQYLLSLGVYERTGTDVQVGIVHMNLGNIAFGRAQHDEAQTRYETALRYFRRANDMVWIAGVLNNLSVIAIGREDIEQVEARQSEALAIYEAAGIRGGIGLGLMQLGIASYLRGDYELTRRRWQRGMDLGRELDNGWLIMALSSNLASMELTAGRREEARALLLECTTRLHDMPDPAVSLPVLESTARWCAEADPTLAARLLGAAVGHRDALGTPLLPYERKLVDAVATQLIAKLGEDAYRSAARDGAALSIDDALAQAERVLGAAG